MSLFPWQKPSFSEQLVRDLEEGFGFSRYRDKTRFFPRFKRYQNTFRNFQWVTQKQIHIARCAQPNYRGQDSLHSLNPEQREFLTSNNIKTIFSFNSKNMDFGTKLLLEQMNIAFHHIKTKDFTAIGIDQHSLIDRTIRARCKMGGVLFYCGYGAGRTGTAVAGFMLKYILLEEPEILTNLSGKQFHSLVQKAFGVEEDIQSNSIVDYLKSLATVEPAIPGGRPRSLSEVSSALFIDIPDTISETTNNLPPIPPPKNYPNAPPGLPPLPPAKTPRVTQKNKYHPAPPGLKVGEPPAYIGNPNNRVRMQSLDPIGTLRNSLHNEFGRPPSVRGSRPTSTMTRRYLSNAGHINLESFYFDKKRG